MGWSTSRAARIASVVIGAVLVFWAAPVRASDYIIISVKHRPAEELVGAVRVILSPTGTVIADKGNNTLVVMDEPAVLEKVRELVTALDTSAKQVRLTVTFFETTDTGDVDLLVRWRYADGGFSIGNYMGIGGGEGLYLSGDARALNERGISTTTQQLVVLSGGSASLVTGRSVPVRGDVLTYLHDGGLVVEGVVFREVMTGFTFTPTILDKDVRIQITPFMSYFTNEGKGSVLFYEARTTVTVAAGRTVVITGNNTDKGKFVVDIFSGFASSGIRGNFYISITPNIEN